MALIAELKAQAQPPEPACEKGGKAVMPAIIITKRFLHSKTRDSIKALETANNPPFVFRRSGNLVKISKDEKDYPKISILGDMQLRGILARVAHFLKETENGPVPTSPPMDLVKDIPGPWGVEFSGS